MSFHRRGLPEIFAFVIELSRSLQAELTNPA